MNTWWAESAWLPHGMAGGVILEERDGRFTNVTAGTAPPPGGTRLPGVVIPGLANGHSHAFHRALRGRTHARPTTFWSWRDAMYSLAGRLSPDSYFALARATYAEMALAGVTSVGEFHYLHHGAGGRPYAGPNEMGAALVGAAAEAGVRLTLLDACYLAGGLAPEGHLPLSPLQERFADRDVEAWAERVAAIPPAPHLVVGSAVHSVRAVPAAALEQVAAAASEAGWPLHIHLSEQRAENDACVAHYGLTPARLCADHGVLGPATTVVHATHVDHLDVALVAGAGTAACICPTTERDLGDGIGPARELADAGVALCLGSDQQATVDLLGEAQALEMDERLASGERSRFSLPELMRALTATGQQRLGWQDAGELRVGARADLVAVRLGTVRTAGVLPEQAVMVAGAADVSTVVVDGRTVVSDGRHLLGDVARLLAEAVEPLWRDGP
ncbi:MAG TPA: formimidoylglutamate deiminase [Acidimicrobiales bacterium]|nr:formimidoylglutamate deiminase [Acidimicrobiales bacterium]